MGKKEHGELYTRAQAELLRAGIKPEGNQDMSSIYHTTLKIVDTVEKGSINEFTKQSIKALAFVLADGELINNVTNYGGEWRDISDAPVFDCPWQNIRNPKIYSSDGGETWVRFDGGGRQQGVSEKVEVTTDASS